MESDTDSDSDYGSYNPSRPNPVLKISHVSSSGVLESGGSLFMRRDGSQFTSQSTQSPSNSSEEVDVEERGSEQSDSNPESPEYHRIGNQFQQYSYSAFTGSGRRSYGRSVSSSESDEDQNQGGVLSKRVDKKALKREPPSSSEGSSCSSVEDKDRHVVKKTKADHEYSDFAMKVLKRKPPSSPEDSSCSSVEDSDKHVFKIAYTKAKADHGYSDFAMKVLKRKPPSSPEDSSCSSVEDSNKHVFKKAKADHEYSDFARKMMEHSFSSKAHEYSDFAKKMMTKMGHQPGTGLGRSGEGIVEPLKESMQRGRAGLGTEGVPELEPEDVEWEEEEVNCEESPEWIVPCSLDPPTVDDEGIDTWFKIGKRKATIEDETLFCDEEVLKQILKNKTVFDSFDRKAFLDARDRSNPFELIKGIIFQNRDQELRQIRSQLTIIEESGSTRIHNNCITQVTKLFTLNFKAAMKMANMDAVFDFMFTGMRDKSGRKITETNELLYFADICAGPGGFTEYVLYRTKWHAKGFGFTLKDPPDGSDFKLDEFHASDCETFEPYYGCHGDGDITNTENLTSLQEHVFEATNGLGVHFVMGDGGISVEGEENIQELLTKQLVLCQFACALSILREGGHFVCCLFDMYTPFLVGLIYLLYRCFEKICIIKPVTSRPANSERYVVCHGFRNTSRSVAEYLFDINDKLNELKDTEQDVIEVVPLHILQQEEEFMTYVTRSNNRIGKQQSMGLRKIQFFVNNRNLLERRQADIKRKCLKLWKFDDEVRKAHSFREHKVIFNTFWSELTKSLEANEANFKPKTLTTDNLPPDVYTWKWYYMCGSRYMLVGAGRTQLKGWIQRGPLSFGSVMNTVNVELPPQTVLDVDVCEELGLINTHYVIEVIDALSISGEFIGNRPFPERQALIHKLCKAVNKPGRAQLRLKKCYRFLDIERMLSKLKDTSKVKVPIIVSENEDGSQTRPKGVVLFKTLKNPWHLQFSTSSQKLYFYNDMTQKSTFEAPPDSVATYQDQLQSRMLWHWQPLSLVRAILGLTEDTSALQKGLLTKTEVTEHMAKRLHL